MESKRIKSSISLVSFSTTVYYSIAGLSLLSSFQQIWVSWNMYRIPKKLIDNNKKNFCVKNFRNFACLVKISGFSNVSAFT